MPTPHDGPAACGWYLNPIEQAPAIYRFASSPLLMRSDSSLKRPQEINDVLLLPSSQPIETFDDLICLAAIALVISNDFHQVGRPSIMEEEDALSDAPERSGSELVGAGTTLRDSVGEAFAHVVDEKVGVKIRRLIGKRSARTGRGAARDLCARGKRGRMAVDTTNPCKSGASFLAGRGNGCGWGQHPHEVGKSFDVWDDRGVRIACSRGSRREVECVLRSGVKEAARRFVALLRKQLVRDAHLDVVCLAREHEKGFVLCLPPETRNGPIVHISA